MTFKEEEEKRQFKFRKSYFGLSKRAREEEGYYRHFPAPYPFVLPKDCSDENLFEGTREQVIDYFIRFGPFHDAINEIHPSNHMCSSQIACLNLLYPIALDENLCLAFLKEFDPDIETVFRIENEQYAAFEWSDDKNLLREPRSKTQVDCVFIYRTKQRQVNMLLLESKYTEPGSARPYTNRKKIYEGTFGMDSSPFELCLPHSSRDSTLESLLIGEGYQLLRLQLLASVLENSEVNGIRVDQARVAFFTPSGNRAVREIPRNNKLPSSSLRRFGRCWDEVWPFLIKESHRNRFISKSWEQVFSSLYVVQSLKWRAWKDYCNQRYGLSFS